MSYPTSLFCIAYNVISALFLTFIFSMIWVRYVLMVLTLRQSSSAISFTVFPEAIISMTWYSRSESIS